jgi:hypothetical protein
MHCKECRPGTQFAAGADVCLNFCATGFQELMGVTTCETPTDAGYDGIAADFRFDTAAIDNVWTYTGTATYPNAGVQTWTVNLYGGSSKTKTVLDVDPYWFDDRGLFFDGKTNYMTSEMLVLHHSFTLAAWVRPYGSGAIYSGSKDFAEDSVERSMHWGINHDRMEFEHRQYHFYTRTEKPSVTQYVW